MNLTIHIGQTKARLWHIRLLERLSRRPGVALNVTTALESHGLPRGAELLFRFETFLHGLARPGLATLAAPGCLARFSNSSISADLTIDLEGTLPADQPNVWRLSFDGEIGERKLLSSIMAGRAPVAALRNGTEIIAIGRLGTDRGGIALTTFEDCLARVITLIAAGLDGAAAKHLPSLDPNHAFTNDAPHSFNLLNTGKKVAKDVARTLVRRVYSHIYNTPHWRVGWRKLAGGEDLIDLRQHPASGWTDLPDDRHRFFADPFPFEYKGAVTLFVEEFDHRLQKGVISAIPFGPDGPTGPAEPVLDLPYHLSYPFVFERDGEVWMISESCAAGAIDLYRATDYPRGWVHDARLVENIVASDATIVQHEGRWWMFATVQDDGGAYSDTLYLWSAPDFRGPWTPHAHNPVLIDIESARGAGRIVERNGALFRPVQDCQLGYGNALGLARITRLDDEGFEQVVEATVRAGPAWPGRRLHTLNSAGGLEFIDGSGVARRGLREILGMGGKPAGPHSPCGDGEPRTV